MQGDGTAFGTGELEKLADLVPQRRASLMDLRNGARQVVDDAQALIIGQQSAALTVQQIHQSAAELAEEQRKAAMRDQLAGRGIQVPNGGIRSGR